MTVAAASQAVVMDERANALHEAGCWALMVLAVALPFEVTQHPLAVTGFDTLTNLKIVVWGVGALAAVSLAQNFVALLRDLSASRGHSANYLYRRRGTVALFAALVLSCGISSLTSSETGNGLRWTLDIALGGLISLTVPLWVSEDPDRRVNRICVAIVAGAVVAAVVGICEVAVGAPIAERLLWFKAGPTMIGQYLRLSGTFQYANIAAFYFELVLPLASVGLLRTVLGTDRRYSVMAGWLVAADVLFCALLLTYSRGAILGLAMGTLMAALAPPSNLLLARIREKQWWVLGLAANLLFVACFAVLASPSLVILRWTSDSDQDWYRAAYTSNLPTTIRGGVRLETSVTVSNLGPLTWSSTGEHAFHLSYHWLYRSGTVALFNGIRSNFSADVPPGRRQTVLAYVQAPNRAGHYRFVWDVVQEGVTWFSLKSATYTLRPVRVVGSVAPSGAAPPSGGPTVLPTSLPAPTRQQLWPAAIRVVAAHPVFGIGPDGFRLSYGAFLRPKQQSWDERILANSLPLEIFADLGLLGGGLFFALLVALARTLIVGLWRGQVVVWWQVALIGSLGAFLGHGLVDYILNSSSTLYLFWLLCGLASASGNVTPQRSARPQAKVES